VLELLFNTAMKVEREKALGAHSHERTEERQGYAMAISLKNYRREWGLWS
jgi:hypothetical protein